jgi:MYXO-CTERM domain-containing protein
MLSAAQAAVPANIDIDTASFTISSSDLQITRNLIPLPPDSAWFEQRRSSIRLSPIVGFAGKPIAPARRVSYDLEPPQSLALPNAKSPQAIDQQVALPASSVPDPAPLGFLGLGLIALGLARRRKRRLLALPGTEKEPARHNTIAVAA